MQHAHFEVQDGLVSKSAPHCLFYQKCERIHGSFYSLDFRGTTDPEDSRLLLANGNMASISH